MQEIYSIIGPTASGKSALAQKLVNFFLSQNQKIILISLDSKQIYKDLPILSGADLSFWQGLENKISIYNLADKDLTTNWSLGLIISQMQEILTTNHQNQKKIILVGGTLLYHQKILAENTLAKIPPNENIRFVADNMTTQQLQSWLKKINLPVWESLNHSDLHNPRRLVRKIEITIANHLNLDTSFSSSSPRDYQQFWFLTNYQLADLSIKIKQRVERRWQNGALSEVRQIINQYPQLITNAQFLEKMPLGFNEIKNFLLNKVTESETKSQWQLKEIQYAKRQITFLKKLLSSETHLIDQREFFSN